MGDELNLSISPCAYEDIAGGIGTLRYKSRCSVHPRWIPTPIFTIDTLDTYKLLVSMLPLLRPPKYFSSDRHRCDQEDTLSTTSEASTLVDNTETIQTLLTDQPFVPYKDPADPHDNVVIRSAPFRKFLEKRNHMGFVASVPWLATALADHEPYWPGAFTVLQLICEQRVMTVADEKLERDKETQRSYGRSLIASSLEREGKIRLDHKNQITGQGKFYGCRLERAYMPREDISYEGKTNGYGLDFMVHKNGGFRIQVYPSEAEIHQPERRGIHLYASRLRTGAGDYARERCYRCVCDQECGKENIPPSPQYSTPDEGTNLGGSVRPQGKKRSGAISYDGGRKRPSL
ncbi:uncharacterized protein GIQ15_03629 [Arthroderma uncinatum]|uniref:uncharacterized protein n=1 Tax=Arthroderma uncinatum TaxID=74035 RepID=UPI00144AC3BC|nr:uncharacterized protein GIQ15_03629 [Arthroderma uncinatum]KAF3484305.1 hypothetical protein GIQ15_03629 [Arthroderma uncinatum]